MEQNAKKNDPQHNVERPFLENAICAS